MTRREQLSIANEITVLCGIAATYFSSYAPPSAEQTQAVFELEEMSSRFMELTELIVEDIATRGICPVCGEDIGPGDLNS